MGPVIQEISVQNSEVEPITLPATNFLTYLQALFFRGGSFHQLLASKRNQNPSSTSKPWSLVVYLDELVPGNVLGRAERKSWAWYASFLQFGQRLHSTDSWLTIALVRSSSVSAVEAGVGQITTALLRGIFCHEMIHPPTGFLLKGPEGQDIRLHFTFSMLLVDGAAQKQVWSSKGESGQKFCFLCANVRATGATEDQMHCNITKYSQLVLTSDAEVRQSHAKLDAKKTQCTKAEFDMWQQATGWNHS